MISHKFQKEIKIKLIVEDKTQKQMAEEFGVDRKRLNKVITGVLEDRNIERKLFRYLNKNRVIIVGFNDNTIRRKFWLSLRRILFRGRK